MNMFYYSMKRRLIGKPLKSTQLSEQRLNKTKALAILSSDALSSVAYGPEQILIVLMTVGMAAFWYSLPIAVGVVILLAILILSYRQIIFAYPHGGGAYMVSKENLGMNPGLIAGGSLFIDYILTVAVSVSAGTDAITSAIPALYDYRVYLAVGLVFLLTVLNLRGLNESASILAYPVYLFIFAILVMIAVGLYQIATGDVSPAAHSPMGTPVTGITLFLLLRAFASGSSALTGVEAISNAIPNFKYPEPVNAAKTLAYMGILLALLFSGIVLISYYFGVAPTMKETVVSQVAAGIFGRGGFYYFIQGTTALILVLAANTGYSAFPLLAVNLTNDQFLPRMFRMRGDRLGYSNGIIFLGVAASLLIIAFQVHTEHLIPLYAVGVFIPFALAQAGMMRKWLREKPEGWRAKLMINTAGAIICFIVLLMFFLTKFAQVWPVLIFLPIVIWVFHQIRKHYIAVGEQLKITKETEALPPDGNVIIVPVSGITRVVDNSLKYARSLSPDQLIAVYVGFEKDDIKAFEKKWEAWQPDVKLVTLYSSYRSIIQPLGKFINIVEKKARESNFQVTVIFPQFIPKKGWHNFLHNQSSLMIRANLLYRKNLIITIVPYHLLK